ncbi:hypothetical protein EJB05_27713 [Eragrostis curvula]|uniref:Exportin-5 C-terminal domain-containing protein n=1 Tax=Eragrostis curvula TaxID=38414 RepID=A0A5J9UP83_9POAL|nr:hypothetical protein EJB05_27713 [Eragrostis curvula]
MAQVECAPAATCLDPQTKDDDERYISLLVRASLMLGGADLPPEVQSHGAKMIEHLLNYRSEKLSSADRLNLTVRRVASPEEDRTLSEIANSRLQNKLGNSLLLLSTKNNLRSLAEEETGDVCMPTAHFVSSTKSEYVTPNGSSHSSSSNTSGTRPDTSSEFSTESSKSSNLQSMCTLGLSFDANKSELEVQRLMSMDISKNDDDGTEVQVPPKHQYYFDTRIIVSQKLTDIVNIRMLGSDGKAACHQVEGCLLLADHNILCDAFFITSNFRNRQYNAVLLDLLKPLNTIWTRPEWERTFLCNGFGLSCLLANGHFLRNIYNVVKFCENELCRSSQDFTEDICSLLHMFLPLLLQLLRCIHSLWKGQISCNLSEDIKTAKVLMNDEEDFQQNETRKLLEQIRESGYNIIGLSMCHEKALTEVLDCSSLSLAFVDLGSMEFRHLSKLIHLIFLPLVENCPREFWKEWMLNFLGPFLRHCEDVLYYAWFSFLHEGRARVSYYFGKLLGSTEDIEKSEHTVLLQFTRDVSHLLGNLSLSKSGTLSHCFEDVNKKRITYLCDSESTSSNSLVGYLFVHGCFGRLRMSLFGYWVDDVAAIKAIPFCCSLVQFAGVSTVERLRLFVSDELLPSIIKRLHDKLPCAIRHLIKPSDIVNKDLIALCRESHNYLSSTSYAQDQDLMLECKGGDSAADDFTSWLEKLKEDLFEKTLCAAPEEFEKEVEWNWEFQDEFERYLPVYIDMLKEVDAMEDTSEHDYFDWEVLLQKLKPEFRLKYAINSREHPYLKAISYMRRGSDCPYSVIHHLEKNSETPFSTIPSVDLEKSVHFLIDSVLYIWEPCFHPLIREGHKDFLLWITDQLTNAEEFQHFEPLAPSPEDFPLHLEPYAIAYILKKLKTSERLIYVLQYSRAVAQVLRHEQYDDHLTSGVLDDKIYKFMPRGADYCDKDVVSWAVPCDFSDLDSVLIKLSLKHKDRLKHLMNELEVEGFFDIHNPCIDWDKKCFSELIDKFSNAVFTDHPLPRHYVIRGIIDYRRTLLPSKDRTRLSFEKVVGEACDRLIAYLPQFWKETLHYKHDFYDILERPLEKKLTRSSSKVRFIGATT